MEQLARRVNEQVFPIPEGLSVVDVVGWWEREKKKGSGKIQRKREGGKEGRGGGRGKEREAERVKMGGKGKEHTEVHHE